MLEAASNYPHARPRAQRRGIEPNHRQASSQVATRNLPSPHRYPISPFEIRIRVDLRRRTWQPHEGGVGWAALQVGG